MSEFTKYTVDEDGRFAGALERAVAALGDLSPAFKSIADDFYRTQGEIFKQSGSGSYPDLSPRYKVRKTLKFGFAYPILRARGKLETAALGGSGSVTDIGPRSLEMGIDEKRVPHAVYHNSDDPRSKMPLRKMVYVGPEAPQFLLGDQVGRDERWLNILNDYVLQRLQQSGLGEVKS